MPGRSGLDILQTLRQRRIETPVLILTARDGVNDRVLGLDLGADDYLELRDLARDVGLAIAKWAVDANGGEISLESEGGALRIALPRARVRSQAPGRHLARKDQRREYEHANVATHRRSGRAV